MITTETNPTANSAQVLAQYMNNCEMSFDEMYRTLFELILAADIHDANFYKTALNLLYATSRARDAEKGGLNER